MTEHTEVKLKSPVPDRNRMEQRADEARLRDILGEPLDETDRHILAYERPMCCSGDRRGG